MVFPTSPCISNEVDTGLVEDKEDDFFFNSAADDTGMEIDDIGIDINDLGEVSATTTSIANQPIAMGFLISTAPALNVPDWFWSQCPNAKNDTPVHLRSALHISVPHVQQNDDVMLAMTENHPLESNKTEEVLTYILQTYNELSWLNIDFISGQRKSCLPIHIQNLLKLYNGFDTTLY
uniref:Mediator of RNA polymerase II transcription subunit 13 n=1 Tax=Panagrolaimus davidi TaxID=227884 RepID=A0A914PGE3_9BILA